VNRIPISAEARTLSRPPLLNFLLFRPCRAGRRMGVLKKEPKMAAKQKELAGMERPAIKEVEEAAEDFRTKRNLRMAAMGPEKDAKTVLLTALKKHKLKTYRYEGEDAEGAPTEFEIQRESKENVKVRSAKDKDEEPEEGEEPE